MVEFRTTVKPPQKEEIVSLMTSALYQIVKEIDICTEENARIVLIKIRFETLDEAKQFIDIVQERQLPLNRWVLHENQKPHASNLAKEGG